MAGSEGRAGGRRDGNRVWRRLDNLAYVSDMVVGDATLDATRTRTDLVNDASKVWKRNARPNRLEFTDPKSDAEAFALPQWRPLLMQLRLLGLPVQRVRALVRGERGGVPFESLCVCDADEDGEVLPYRIWVLRNTERLPDLICDYRSSRGEVPDDVAWCDAPGAFAKAAAFTADRPVIAEGRFTKSLIGRAIAGKINDFLDTSVQVTVWAKDSGAARAVAEAAKDELQMLRVVWMARGGMFVYATPNLTQGADPKQEQEHLFTHKLVALQRKYAAILNG
ncbi:hypothetical protein [Glycomyces tritici]|uniref:Uncharacterized protein n=1 Tax=Glycomyces tritici TaxID=2665176 RepID=A0ABT7YRL4_9ACTN|nr:hypothetical protein [Glycomyces tritici]MDN3241281.1 hypothetical protein [Glycomyces tritici]MDN3243304.1 hypothetical protein [Glycomyces tritici]